MANSEKPDAKKKALAKEVNRGTQDEMEILALILLEHSALRQVIMDRLRVAKQRHLTREKAMAGRAQND